MTRRKNDIDIIKILKTVDPIIQTVFIIAYFFFLDRKGGFYQKYMILVLKYQMFSSILHLFIKYHKKLKIERFIFIAIWIGYYVTYLYVRNNYEDKVVHIREFARGFNKIGVFDFILMSGALAIAIWYYAISFREINALYNKRKKSK